MEKVREKRRDIVFIYQQRKQEERLTNVLKETDIWEAKQERKGGNSR
jgi:hypothetical protein